MMTPFAVEAVEANLDITVETLAGLRETYLAFNLHTDTPLQDKDVRHTIGYGIDRDRLIDMAFGG